MGFTRAHFAPPQQRLPDFEWKKIIVADPRVRNRTMDVRLLTQNVLVPDTSAPPAFNGARRLTYHNVLVNPVCFVAAAHPTNRILEFNVLDGRYPAQVVQYLTTEEQAREFCQNLIPLEQIRAMQQSEHPGTRYKCYVPGCRITSSRKEKIHRHFTEEAHPIHIFDVQKVLSYRIDGPDDREYLGKHSFRNLSNGN